MFSTVLIANRGEIALRVARTCRELGIRTVAVYATPDSDSAVVRFADASVHIGPEPARRSYLNAAAIVEAARQTGAEAIHPGYGFLAEDPDFAEICAANGITFIGPPAPVMARLGDKSVARELMAEAGLPILPSGTGTLDTVTEAKRVAERVDYPLILKAAAGGGGRGMAVVREPGELARTYEQTRAHAQAVFGDSRVYAERYVEAARHVEVQVLCDRHGHAVHLGERDCSVQRRHQKLVEESPAPNLPPDLLDAICRAAVRGAGAVGYVGAGTFEFLVDTDNRFYFMEVNSRLQVEHGVTEMVTGIDLVREQIEVAAGRPLPFGQQDVLRRGVAVECRVNSEDPAHDFAPTPGTLTEFRPPSGPFTRVDTHAFPGWRIPPGYDSLLAKVIVWAPTRPQALVRMRRALQEFHIAGPQVRTTAAFLRKTMAHPWFREAKHTTSFVDQVLAGQADADDA